MASGSVGEHRDPRIATHTYSEATSEELKGTFFGHVQSSELKHASLRRRPANRLAICRFLSGLESEKVRVAVAHKRFALTGKLVDVIVEPSLHRAGLNMYEDGLDQALWKFLYAALQVEGSTTLDAVLKRFQRLVRERTMAAMQEFQSFLQRPALLEVIEEALDILRVHATQLEWSDISTLPRRALDVSFVAGLYCVYSWRTSGLDRMRIVHDASTNMAEQSDLWTGILSPSAPPAALAFGGQELAFPIGVESTAFENSRDSNALQIADIIAGALCYWTRWSVRGRSADDAYGCALNDVVAGLPEALFAWALWPDTDIRRDPSLSSSDHLEYVTERARAVTLGAVAFDRRPENHWRGFSHAFTHERKNSGSGPSSRFFTRSDAIVMNVVSSASPGACASVASQFAAAM